MNLVIDRGNTRIKIGLFNDVQLVQHQTFSALDELKNFLKVTEIDNVLISSVNDDPEKILSLCKTRGKKLSLNSMLSLPIKNNYQTPSTLGVDRIAAACGAQELFPGRNCLVIDAGTCINYEFLDASGTYQGGAISPGISMRFQAMNTFTARLPLISPIDKIDLVGKSTESCMQSGVMNGILEEVKGIITQYKERYQDLMVIICGGDYPFFENNLKPAIFVAPELVLIGLNRILCYHVELQKG